MVFGIFSFCLLLPKEIVRFLLLKKMAKQYEEEGKALDYFVFASKEENTYGLNSYITRLTGGLIIGIIVSLIFHKHILTLELLGNEVVVSLRVIIGIFLVIITVIHIQNTHYYMKFIKNIKNEDVFSTWKKFSKIRIILDFSLVATYVIPIFLRTELFLIFIPIIIINSLNYLLTPSTYGNIAQKFKGFASEERTFFSIVKKIIVLVLLISSFISSILLIISVFKHGYISTLEIFFQIISQLFQKQSLYSFLVSLFNFLKAIAPFFSIILLYPNMVSRNVKLRKKYFQGATPPLQLPKFDINLKPENFEVTMHPIVIFLILTRHENMEQIIENMIIFLFKNKIEQDLIRLRNGNKGNSNIDRINTIVRNTSKLIKIVENHGLFDLIDILTGNAMAKGSAAFILERYLPKMLDKNFCSPSTSSKIFNQDSTSIVLLYGIEIVLMNFYKSFCDIYNIPKFRRMTNIIMGIVDTLSIIIVGLVAYPVIAFHSIITTVSFIVVVVLLFISEACPKTS